MEKKLVNYFLDKTKKSSYIARLDVGEHKSGAQGQQDEGELEHCQRSTECGWS